MQCLPIRHVLQYCNVETNTYSVSDEVVSCCNLMETRVVLCLSPSSTVNANNYRILHLKHESRAAVLALATLHLK